MKRQQRKLNKSKEKNIVQQEIINVSQLRVTNKNLKIYYLIVFLVAFFTYSNTFNHKYVLDDYSVIKQNFVTQKGIEGIPIHFKTGYRYGFWNSPDNLYRPLTLAFFALEWEISEDDPTFYHVVNVIIFSILCVVIFIFLRLILPNISNTIHLLIAVLFATHPIHTEVTANIKSLDEIFSLLFSLISLILFFKLLRKRNIFINILFQLSFLLGMLSKENTILFVLIIPLTAYFFTNEKPLKIILNSLYLLIPVLIFFAMREKAIGQYLHLSKTSYIDNVLVAAPNIFVRTATAFKILGMYFLKLVVPYPLACDYSYNQIKLVNWTNIYAIVSLVFHLSLGIFAIVKFKKKNIFSYLILFYFISMALTSNLIYLIGTSFGERLLFTPSLPFVMFLGLGIGLLFKELNKSVPLKTLIITIPIVGVYLYLTIDRNKDWRTSLSLYEADIKKSPDSGHMNYYYALELMNAVAMKDGVVVKPEYLDSAIKYFRKSLKITPTFAEAYEQMGLAYYRKNQWDTALVYFDSALVYFPTKYSTYSYIGAIYFNRRQLQQAVDVFEKAVRYNPKFADGWFNLGSAYGETGQYEKAIEAFKKCLEFDPKKAEAYYFIGITYKNLGKPDLAEPYFQKAYSLKPSLKK
ncbi:MAG: tetratricopeptide repeat protein [Bacteroidales bacterium]|nr:tetratricopeptide repeat protein [Bacteroidales bacterium]